VCRGLRFDAAVNRLLLGNGIVVSDLTRGIAQCAGEILRKAQHSSGYAIDAFVVVSALDYDSAVIATGDEDDMRRHAEPYRTIRVFRI
jgi:hypothetical protein